MIGMNKQKLFGAISALGAVLRSQRAWISAAISGLMIGKKTGTPSRGRGGPGPTSPAGGKALRRAYKNHKQRRGTYDQARAWFAALADGVPGTRKGGKKHNFYVQ